MDKTELTDHIKTLINEISPTNGLAIPVDSFADDRPLDDMVAQLLPEATRIVLLSAPTPLQPVVVGTVTTATLQPDGCAVWRKPADYLQLATVRLPHWQRGVVVAALPGSEAWRRQGNPYLRAGAAKPVVVDVGNSLQLWPATQTGHLKGTVEYVPDLPPEHLVPRLQQALCWKCAALYLQVVGDEAARIQAEKRVDEALG